MILTEELQKTSFVSDHFIEEISDHLFLKKGQSLYCESNTPLGVYFVKEGKVKISKLGSDGKEQIVRMVADGEILNLADILSKSRYASSATILEDSEILFIPKNEFLNLLGQQTHFFEQLIMLLSVDLKIAQQKLTDMAYKPVRGRLAESLIFLSSKFHNDYNELPFVSITRYNLACYIGTAKETVNRLISEFRNEGLISVGGKRINIIDLNGLKAIVRIYS